MAARSRLRGHPIIWDEGWVYEDSGQGIDDGRPCLHCNRFPTKEGHDACLGYIPGVTSACCGHGVGKMFVRMKDEK